MPAVRVMHKASWRTRSDRTAPASRRTFSGQTVAVLPFNSMAMGQRPHAHSAQGHASRAGPLGRQVVPVPVAAVPVAAVPTAVRREDYIDDVFAVAWLRLGVILLALPLLAAAPAGDVPRHFNSADAAVDTLLVAAVAD